MIVTAKKRSDKEKDKIYKRWRELINMSAQELEAWGENPDRLEASLDRKEAEKSGDIQSGFDSLHRIKRRVKKNRSDWSDEDYDNAAQENGFNSRMLGNKPGKVVPGTGRSKWEISLRNWGHDPRKKSSPAQAKFKAWENKNKEALTSSKNKKAFQRVLASRVAALYLSAARMSFWHGTTSKNLRKILKEGLNPKPKNLVFDEEEGSFGTKSMKTFGGVYLTDNPQVAHGYASGAVLKQGGNPLILGLTYETRTPGALADEDDVIPLIERVTGLGSASGFTDLRTLWGEIFHSKGIADRYMPGGVNILKYPEVKKVIETVDLSEPAAKFWEVVIKDRPEFESRYNKMPLQFDGLAEDAMRAHAKHLLEMGYLDNKKDIARDVEKRIQSARKYDEGERLERSERRYQEQLRALDSFPFSNTFPEFRDAVDALSQKAKELSNPDNRKWRFRHNVRAQDHVGFRGKNRILLIVEEINKKSESGKRYTDIVVRYLKSPDMLDEYLKAFRAFERSSGFRVLDSSGRNIIPEQFDDKWNPWPEDLWGPSR